MKVFNLRSVNDLAGMSNADPSRLISDCIAGDEHAIEMLVRQYETDVFRLALSILDDTSEAKEATQETFIAALKSLRTYQEKSSFKAWLFTIAVNISRNHLRKRRILQRLRTTLISIFQVEAQKQTLPEDAVIQTEREAAIWSRRPTPLSTEQIISLSKNKAFAFASGLLTTRTATIVLMMFAILITTWRFSTNLTSDPVPSVVIPVPRPSTQLTSTIVMTQECAYVTYQVQEDDSWASIASQFSVSQEMLMDFNGMEDETVLPSMQIRIPVCDRTPTATDDTPTTTITITPQFESITLTPG